MLSALMLAAALSGADPDVLTDAIERYRKVESYRVTIRSVHADAEEHLRYFYQKPGFVRRSSSVPMPVRCWSTALRPSVCVCGHLAPVAFRS
ncbi:MAG: hypothetical protein Q7K57_02175 [Burkholderiaceae bacterium]|nr:hypothetical protein [Burkholderiaceae bacterium]